MAHETAQTATSWDVPEADVAVCCTGDETIEAALVACEAGDAVIVV